MATKFKLKLLLLILIALNCSTSATYSLLCLCNVCQNNETCETSPHNDSQCYKSVEKVYNQEEGTYTLEASYGCLSGGDGFLANLQCHVKLPKSAEPKHIGCCKGWDFCNDELPDPRVEDDPRWNTDRPVAPSGDGISPNTRRLLEFGGIAAISIVAGIVLVCSLIRISLHLVSLSRSSKDSRGSICSLKADLEKFHHQFAASSSVSTHSYSISEDLCHKPSEPANDDSFMQVDSTSGTGERMLTHRTMARAVGFGKTDPVGEGRFGRVFRGQYHGEDVAVKAFKSIDSGSWKREDSILRILNHDNVVRFIASEVTPFEDSSEIWMFLEYCPFGSLCDYLDHNEVMGPQQAVKILFSIINGLNYLHEDYAQASRLYKPSIAHRDIKSKNILMKTPESCCIADFGHALFKIDEDILDHGVYQYIQVGTIRYMAPEILRPSSALNYKHFSTFAQADLYQYGLILWEVCYRTVLDILHPAGPHKLPYDGVVPLNPGIQDMIKIVCDDQYRPPRCEKWDKYPVMKRIADLMVECWRPNPKARMETLGVKKRLREMYDQVTPSHREQYQLNLYNNLSFSPSYKSDRDKTN